MAHPYQNCRDGAGRAKRILKADGGDVSGDPDYPRWGHTAPTTDARDMMQDRSNARIGDFMKSIRQGREAGRK